MTGRTKATRKSAKAATRARKSSAPSRPRSAAKSSTARKPAARKPAAKKKTTARKQAARKTTARKSAARTSTAKKSTARKTTAKKTTAKKTTARKTAAKKSTAKKSPARRTAASRGTSATSTSRSATGRSKTSRSTTAKKTTTRGATGRTTTTKRARRTSQARSVAGHDDAPAAFRAKRRTKSASSTTARKGRGRRRRASLPVTDAGERNAAFLTATVLGLTLFGLVMVLSASSVSSVHEYADSPFSQFKRQLIWAGLGAVAFIVASRFDYRLLRRFAVPLLIITISLLVALLIPGVGITANGSARWLGFGPFVIQPSELGKLVLVIFLADLLTRRERRMDRPELTVRPAMMILGLLSALIILQPKLGTPIIMASVTLLVLFVAGARMKNLLAWLSMAVVAASVLAYYAPYRRARVLAFLNPWDSPQGIGLQAIQSQVGIASGGLFGVGLGASRAKWGFLPFAHTDFIFAIVAEEVGLVGASALIGGFLLISWFGFRAALSAPDRFGMLLAAGITSWLLVQAFLNIGMVLGVLPITGEPLPFVSAGGSSLVTTLAAAGLLTSVSKRAQT